MEIDRPVKISPTRSHNGERHGRAHATARGGRIVKRDP